jgi:hypothetical protein
LVANHAASISGGGSWVELRFVAALGFLSSMAADAMRLF